MSGPAGDCCNPDPPPVAVCLLQSPAGPCTDPPIRTRPEAPLVPTPIETVIIDSARRHGVDPYLAVATAEVESALNPAAEGDPVAGRPTSFGLFQLHQGGELGTLTVAQAEDPATNADVALAVLAGVVAEHPTWTPGEQAAAAQRPADPTTYAERVNYEYGQLVGPNHTRLWRYLRWAEPLLMRGADVRALQFALGISPDGVFGTVTLAHVQSFQTGHRLADDGIVGPLTCAALGWSWDG